MSTRIRLGRETTPSGEETRPGWVAMTLPQVWAVVAVALPVAFQSGLSTVDLAYHIRAGQIMLRTHSVIRTDIFSFTAAGRPWLNQQWGAQVLLAALFRLGGWAALGVAQAVLVGLTFLFVFLACRSYGASARLAAGLTLASFALAIQGLTLRPQLFGMALFAVTVWLVAKRRSRPEGLWALPLLAVVWANVHGSFFLAPAILGLAWVQDRLDRSPIAGKTLGMALLTAAASILNPFGIRVWSYAFSLSTNPRVTQFVSEWQPPTVRHYTGALFFASGLAVAGLLARRARPVRWASLLTLAAFFVLGLLAVRGVFWWALAAPPVVAGVVASQSRPRRTEERGSSDSSQGERSPLNAGIAAMFVALAIFMAVFPWVEKTNRTWPPERLVDSAPAALTAAVRGASPPGARIFNAQRWGSWFELALPGRPVFVDSRIEVYPSSVWADYKRVSDGRQGWQQILARWQVTLVVADRGEQAGLLPLIRRDPGWRLIHQDSDGLVFVRS